MFVSQLKKVVSWSAATTLLCSWTPWAQAQDGGFVPQTKSPTYNFQSSPDTTPRPPAELSGQFKPPTTQTPANSGGTFPASPPARIQVPQELSGKPNTFGSRLPGAPESIAPAPPNQGTPAQTLPTQTLPTQSDTSWQAPQPLGASLRFGNPQGMTTPPAAGASDALMTLTSDSESLIKTSIQSPKFINVNKPAEIRIGVANTGPAPVQKVTFLATLPSHTKLISSTPAATSTDGQLVSFDLDQLSGMDQRDIVLQVMPTQRQPIDIATSVRTINPQKVLIAVREPELDVVVNGPTEFNVGQTVKHEVIISNVGDGVASAIEVQTALPDQLLPIKSSLGDTIPDIEPGKSYTISYESRAIAPGKIAVKSSARSDDGNEPKLGSLELSVFEPKLEIDAVGPKVNFVNRNGIYTLTLKNPGEVDVHDVDLALKVPQGLKVTTISREAQVDAANGVLRWHFDRIGLGSSEQIQLMAIANEAGAQICDITVGSQETAQRQIQVATQINTRSDLRVLVRNETGPVQVGGKAMFAIEVANEGDKKAVDVNVKVDLPPSLKVVPAEGQQMVYEGDSIVFTEPQIEAGKKVLIKFSAIGQAQGEHVVRSETRFDGSLRRLIAEDTVLIYNVEEARVSESLTPDVIRR